MGKQEMLTASTALELSDIRENGELQVDVAFRDL